MMPFLYFPEDKTEYIPAVIALTIFIILAVVAMYLMVKKSRKDERKFNKQYQQQLENNRHTTDHT
ncbi:hypothetical protein [Oceanobacillus profundus]|uniref:Uncharacterized protein n=1 Tax=Oceanobacillus profundus TaxID=372463 RepID=A0A417YM44_9BACI|nr:hypothetical protein [Oceanobacillus profundus]MBR3121012.1 hypothetical protein [Oceanobacillus sp.]PAE29725.1 hypothetical protein CHI07_07845 [Paenibacillus sp. 7884-2]MCM3400201.1 hypothetical protein [Oceanobacillus profundus]MDO6449095.1 hypothetical protein [Oceanobacillus profundus]RHW34566.1 hypothetical protein D1B32_05250 [Oceanobacillus profundus]